MHSIRRLKAEEFLTDVDKLADLLVDAVADGASIGFVTPFDHQAASAWWRARATAVADGSLAVWTAAGADGVQATISLALTEKPNARHRAEISKLIVHRKARGQGLARALLATAQAAAGAHGVTLLLLDTQTGSAAEHLYLSEGWTRFGIVPDYAETPDSVLKDCSFFYKQLAGR